MKKFIAVLMLVNMLAACNNSNNATGADDPVDSLEERKDTLLKTVDSTIDAKVDSLKERGEALKQTFDSTYDKKIDSAKGNTRESNKK